MKRGAVWLVNLDPVSGSEANKTRPAVIVSNDAVNATTHRLGRGVVTVVPITSNTTRVFSFQVLLDAGTAGLTHPSKAQAEQVRAVDVSRLVRSLGALPPALLAQVDTTLRTHLAL